MVPYTRTGGWASYKYGGNYFWAPDIKRVRAEWALLQGDIQAHVEGAEEKAATYQAQRVLEVKRIAEHANKYHYRVRHIGKKSRKKAIAKQMLRFGAIQTRLLALGHDARDISYTAFYPPEFQRGNELTDKSWAHMHAEALALVELRRDARLEGEQILHRFGRIRVLQRLYLKHVETVAPREWCYLPTIFELVELPLYKGIIDAESSLAVSPQNFLSAGQLPMVIPEWAPAKKARLTAALGPRSGMVDNPLDLATSVFECANSACVNKAPEGHTDEGWQRQYPLISWEIIAAHSCQPIGQYKLAFPYTSTSVGVSHLGGIVAAVLVREAGLDTALAIATQMDELDLRFSCLECLPLAGKSGRRVGYPWKYAVMHGMRTQHTTWNKMSPIETVYVSFRDWLRSWRGSWSCNHCAEHFNKRCAKSEVLKHLKNVHDTVSPEKPGDLFWCPGEQYMSSSNLGSIKIIEPAPTDVENVTSIL